MIDTTKEQVLTLTDASKLSILPRRRKGKRPCVQTRLRWAASGCRGVILETVRMGSTLCTSVEALKRFVEGMTRGWQADKRTGPEGVSTAIERRLRVHGLRQEAANRGQHEQDRS